MTVTIKLIVSNKEIYENNKKHVVNEALEHIVDIEWIDCLQVD